MEGFRLNRFGVFLDKLGLLDYWVIPRDRGALPKGYDVTRARYPIIEGQVLDYPSIELFSWLSDVRQFFCCHRYEKLYRIPRDGERFIPRYKLGLIEDNRVVCENCGKTTTLS